MGQRDQSIPHNIERPFIAIPHQVIYVYAACRRWDDKKHNNHSTLNIHSNLHAIEED
jgi:hypothetical protein